MSGIWERPLNQHAKCPPSSCPLTEPFSPVGEIGVPLTAVLTNGQLTTIWGSRQWSRFMSRIESKSVWARFGRQDLKDADVPLTRSPVTRPAKSEHKPGLY